MMTMDVSKAETGPPGAPQQCAGCGKQIQDRYLLRALDLLWHEDCLKCGCCDCRLGEVGSTLYTKANLILCKRDYLRLFGNTGYCAACNKVIPAFEMVMRARTNVYHLECFACQQCNHRFCVGDRFYLCENKILCEYDYEERLVFASMAHHPILKRHAGGLPQVTNGLPPQSHQMMPGAQSHQQQQQQQQQQMAQCPPRGGQGTGTGGSGGGDPNNNGLPTSQSGQANYGGQGQHLKSNGQVMSLGATS